MSGAPTTVSRLVPWLRYGVSLSVLGWVAWQIDWRELGGLAAIDWQLAFPAVLLAGIAYPLQAWRWQLLLATHGVPLAAGRIHSLFWIGNFYNSFLPGGIAGDGVRLFEAWREHPQHKAAVAASVVVDRLLGLGALLTLTVLALAAQLAGGGSQRELEAILFASAAALGILVAATAIVTRTQAWDEHAKRWLGAAHASSLRETIDALGGRPGTLMATSAISVAVWLLDFASLWLLALSVGLAIDPLVAIVAASAAYVAAALPISIGGHGIREGALVLALGWLGANEPERVRLLALAFWASTTGWSLAGAVAFFLPHRRQR